MKILESLKRLLGITPSPIKITKKSKLEMLMYLRERLTKSNGFMCLMLYSKFRDEDVLTLGLKAVLPELYKERPLSIDSRGDNTAWGTSCTPDEDFPIYKEADEMWKFRKQAVENAIITLQNSKD